VSDDREFMTDREILERYAREIVKDLTREVVCKIIRKALDKAIDDILSEGPQRGGLVRMQSVVGEAPPESLPRFVVVPSPAPEPDDQERQEEGHQAKASP